MAALAAIALAGAQPAGADAERLFAATLTDLHGQPVKLASLKGQPLVVSFWASWCKVCRQETAELSALRERLSQSDVQMIGLALDDDPDLVADFARRHAINYPLLLAKGYGVDLMHGLGNDRPAVPYLVAINRNGRVAWRHRGPAVRADLDRAAAAATRKEP
jgi:peroxiredoxin